jgi:hypothetical protein
MNPLIFSYNELEKIKLSIMLYGLPVPAAIHTAYVSNRNKKVPAAPEQFAPNQSY